MEYPSKSIEKTVEAFSRLPGVGKKTALRLTLHLLKRPDEEAQALGASILALKADTCYCQRCHNLADETLCRICANPKRDAATICIVEDARDLIAIEKTNQYNGLYHVLGGVINPIAGVGPSELQLESLFERVAAEPVKEIILALGASMEGETTAFYIVRKLKDSPVKITNIARGIPVGAELEFTDEITLARSLMNRTAYQMN